MRKSISFVIIIVVVFAIYGRILNAPFVFDDIKSIVDNPQISNLSSLLTLDSLTKPRSLTDLTFSLNHWLAEEKVFSYHMVNIVIHIINTMLVFLISLFALGRIMPGSRESDSRRRTSWIGTGALLSALFFAVHPLQIMSVTYIVQRYTSMAALFSLLAVIFYILARLNIEKMASARDFRVLSRVLLFILLVIVSGGLGFLSKQSAVMIPGLIVLVELTMFSRRDKCAWLVPVLAGSAAVALVVFVFYAAGMFSTDFPLERFIDNLSRKTMETSDVSRWMYFCTQAGVIVSYLGMTIFPAGLNIDHDRVFVSGFWEGFTPVYFLILLSLLIVAVLARKRARFITFGVFWFFIALSVESSFIPIRDAMFEHRMYLPLAGLSIIFGAIFSLSGIKGFKPVFSLFIAFAVIAGLSVTTLARNELWRDPVRLWEDSVSKTPYNARAWSNLGHSRMAQGNYEGARSDFEKSLNLKPSPFAQGSLGVLYHQMGEDEKARTLLEKAVRGLPRNTVFRYNLAVIQALHGQTEQAIKNYRKVLNSRPDYTEARMNLGIELARTGKLQEALLEFKKVIEKDPENFSALRNYGLIMLNLGRFREARSSLSAAFAQNPDADDVLTYMAIASMQMRDLSSAKDYLVRAIKINPSNTLAMKQLQALQARKGDR